MSPSLFVVANKPYTSLSGTEQFKIRLITTETNRHINALVKEGWGPGLQDAECFLACDPTAGFVGELNGKPIGCMKMANWLQLRRGWLLYRKMIFDASVAIVNGPSRSIGIISSLSPLEEMHQCYGFHSQFYVAFFSTFKLP